jgi:NADP-dependent aldehyde dehydrogenase
MVATAIDRAVEATGMPKGVFSMLHGRGHGVGLALVRHPLTKAVGFTGSLKAGRALFDAANGRPEPIPVYAEMGSINPVFVLPGALAERGKQIAEGLKNSVTLGVGQFCTCPGLVVGLESAESRRLAEDLGALLGATPPGVMLYPGIGEAFARGAERMAKVPGVAVAARGQAAQESGGVRASAVLFETDAETFLSRHELGEELFGPSTMIVNGKSKEDLLRVARSLEGQLTATIHGTPEDLREHAELVAVLGRKVGRLVFNGYPTGIEPCPAVHHGGPYPATSDGRTTSIGTAAIERWVRPLCYQSWPQAALPEELRDDNPRGIWRMVDGQVTKDPVRNA